MSTLTLDTAPPVRAVSPVDVMAAANAYRTAQAAADEARSTLTRAQCTGPDPLPREVEFLLEEAEARWDALTRLACIDRHRTEPVTPMAADWRDSVAAVDWTQSRGAA